MSRFMTTLGNLGLLAGQLSAADKQKKTKQRAAAEEQRQFNLGLASKYDIARFNQDQANRRAILNLEGTLGGAMIRANAKGQANPLNLGNMSALNDMINTSVLNYSGADGTPLFGNDAFDGNDLSEDYTGVFGTITGLVRDQVLSGQVGNDPQSINKAINDALNLLSPQINKQDRDYWFTGDDNVLGFGGEMGEFVSSFRQKVMQTPPGQRGDLINNLRNSLTGRGLSLTVANQIIRLIQQGL